MNDEIAEFADHNCLRINASKTKIMQMHTAQTRDLEKPTVLLNGELIGVANQARVLGVQFSDTMSWQAHCEEVRGKLRGTTFLFVKMRPRVSQDKLRQLYFGHVQSHILHSLVNWGGSRHLEEVFIAQKRVLRAMAGMRYWKGLTPVESCRPLFKKFNILPVFSLYVLECVKFIRKYPERFVKLSDLPENLQNNRPCTRNHNVDLNYDLFVQDTKLKVSSQNPQVKAARIYNKLPTELKSIQEENLFVSKVQCLLEDKMFYDEFEFFGCCFTS
jgi:hypothetical protein